MKILHTSDWHLGHRLHEHSQQQEQELFLQWMIDTINKQSIDVLIISGDIFDVNVPSTQSQKMYYNFLINLKNTNCKHIVITAGNHDAPGNIDAPKELLQALSIDVVGRANEDVSKDVFKYTIGKESIIIAAVPYLRDQDIRRAVSGENFDQINERYRKALMTHYQKAADYCDTINENKCPQIAMGHLFAIGGNPSDSEQSIYVGSLGDIAAVDFPKSFDYIALGHLHRAQIVAKNPRIRYSGSPIALSFSEANSVKKVVEFSIENNEIKDIQELEIPKFREIIRIKAKLESVKEQLSELANATYDLIPWVEVEIDNEANNNIGFTEVQNHVNVINEQETKVEVLKVVFKNNRNTIGLNDIVSKSQEIKNFTPVEVFKEKCKEQEYDLLENAEILDAFNEIINQIQEGR